MIFVTLFEYYVGYKTVMKKIYKHKLGVLLIARRCINNNMEYNCRIHHKKHKNKSSDIFTDPVSITITIHAAHQYKDVSSSEGVSSFSEKNTLAPACPHERIP